eukprot:g1440.t1
MKEINVEILSFSFFSLAPSILILLLCFSSSSSLTCPEGSRLPRGYQVQGCSGSTVTVDEEKRRYTVDGVEACVCAEGRSPYPGTTCAVSNELVVKVGDGKCLGPDGSWGARAINSTGAFPRGLATPALAPDPSSPGSAVLFGGWSQLGAQEGLWRYNQTAGWARLDAAVPAASRPLARFGAQLWVHAPSSAIYLFGGSPPVESADLTARNDLWRFDAAGSGSWDELKAGNGDRGIYDVARGTLYPGARRDYMLWQDRASSAVYLFGGNGLDYNSDIGLLNDLWRSRGPSYTEWEFVAGSQSLLAPTRDINLGYPCTGQKRSQELWKYNTTTTRFTLIGPVDADDNGGSATGGASTGADAAAAASSASGAQVVADDAGGAATEARDRAAAFVGSSGELGTIGT